MLNSPLINYLPIACSVACCNLLCVFLGLSSWRRRWPYSKKRSTIWMTCWKANRGKSDTWSSRWDEHVRLYKANTLCRCSSLRRDRSLSVSVCSFLAPELSHGDPGAGPRDQRAGGESGIFGGWGEDSFSCKKICLRNLNWRVRVKSRPASAIREKTKGEKLKPVSVLWL